MTKHTCTLMHCDSMVRRLLPPMRAEMVSRLVQKQGLSQSEAAKKLGVTRAAVCQYMSRKRGAGEVEISSEMDLDDRSLGTGGCYRGERYQPM